MGFFKKPEIQKKVPGSTGSEFEPGIRDSEIALAPTTRHSG